MNFLESLLLTFFAHKATKEVVETLYESQEAVLSGWRDPSFCFDRAVLHGT